MTSRSRNGILKQEETYLRDEPPTPTMKWIKDFVKDYEAFRDYMFGDLDRINFDAYHDVKADMGENGVEKEARQCLDDAMEGGGFILSTGDQCGRNTPDGNITRLVKVCEKYGKY